MTKSAKRSIIISAILAIIMCASLAAGATFALFTSESTVNIAVTSGKVNVVATIVESSLKTYSGENLIGNAETDKVKLTTDFTNGENGKFINGGTATLVGDTLTLKNMTPGDKVTFNITVTNKSNVAVNYRTVWMSDEDDGLMAGLTVTADGASYDGSTSYTHWATLAAETNEDGSVVKTIPVTVELLSDKGNEYQNKSCKLIFTVEAVQGNAHVDNYVAKIGETGYETLEEAVTALNGGEVGNTLEITRPGTYAPFKITREGATVKGIIGKTKAQSTVIKNTATQNIKAYADYITLKKLWIDSTTPQSIYWMNAGAVDPYISTDSGITAQNITIDGCTIDGTGAAGKFAFLYCEEELTLTDNTFNNFDVVYSAMCDNGSLTKATITGNTFNNVTKAVDGYWGNSYESTDYNIIITGNTMNGAAIHLWDYHQFGQKDKAASDGKIAIKAQIKNNIGDYSVILTHNNWFADNGHDIEESANVYYRRLVKFDVDSADYKVYNKDGSELNTVMGDSTTLKNDAGFYLYAITEGEYLVKNTVNGETYPLTVKTPEIGKTQVFKPISDGFAQNDAKEYLISNANGMTAYRNYIEAKTMEINPTIRLSEDIDMTGVVWKTPSWNSMRDGNGENARVGTFDGQGHSISNMVINGKAMFVRLGGTTVFKNVTFDNCSNNEGGIDVNRTNDSQFRAIIASQYVSDVTFDNVTIKNSHVAGYWGCGLFVGNVGNDDAGGKATFNNCHIEDCTVGGWDYYCGGFVGVVYTETEYTGSNTISGLRMDYVGIMGATKTLGYIESSDKQKKGISGDVSNVVVDYTTCSKVKVEVN